jgi:hypothetical protein
VHAVSYSESRSCGRLQTFQSKVEGKYWGGGGEINEDVAYITLEVEKWISLEGTELVDWIKGKRNRCIFFVEVLFENRHLNERLKVQKLTGLL